ncbi:restriction endonuclease subunit S [Flavobacterium sp. GP15]|uniref:restriction endonuclease subunit S n=1 Tax=Flavobacterium sp. GP15 TaxID=2758567 RepID=UPI00165DD7EC|nr:restriction endonuclease subunit S [Flavobacterium sp. GP15]
MVKSGYKQTEIGVIPEDWQVRKLGELAYITKLAGYEYSKYFNSYKDGGNIVVIRGTNITDNKLNLSDVKYIPVNISNFLVRSKLFKEDLVFAYVGTIGPIYKVDENDRFHLGPNTAKIRIEDQNVDSSYINNYFLSELIKKEIDDRISVGAQPSLSMAKIRDFNFILPPLPEQQAIAEALSDADAWIESLEQLIAKKRLLKQGTMQDLLTPKEDWEVTKLGQMTNIYTGKKNNQDKIENGAFPFFVRSQKVEKINSYSFDGEAILVPGEGNLGSIFHYINGKFDFHQRVYKVSDFKSINGKYTYWYFRMYFGQHAMQNTVKATVDSIRLPTLQDFQISFPKSLSEQTRIATILSDMDLELAALEKQLEKAKQIKQGMMQELLTGRIRLV